MTVKELKKILESCDDKYDIYYVYSKHHKDLPNHIKDERITKVIEK